MSICICGKSKSKLLFPAGEYTIVRCISCGQVRTETPANTVRKQYYEDEDVSIYIQKEEEFRRLFRNVLSFIKRYRKKGRLLDIGAGVGLLVSEARKAGFTAIGFEPSKGAVAAAKKHFGITLLPKEFHPKNVDGRMDVLVINHVLEHLPDPKGILGDIVDVLDDGGLLVIGVPNFGSFLSLLKRNRWQSLIPDQHRWHFTLSTLDELVLPFGFVRIGQNWENHDRATHYPWKKPFYWIFDQIALRTGSAEAMLVAYKKIS